MMQTQFNSAKATQSDKLPCRSLYKGAKIREAIYTDADAIHHVLKSAFAPLAKRGYSKIAVFSAIGHPWRIRERIISEFPILVAEIEDEIIGTITGIAENESMKISSFAVHPAHQGNRIGQKLLLAIEEIAVKNGCNKTFLFTTWPMFEAIRLYNSLGYEKEGHLRRHFYGEDLLIFSKHLN
ncbi:MAG: GNAT family N-acetyltransferase [Promethearchaeota archaeon]